MTINDPITGARLDIYCCEANEIYRCNEEKAIQTIMQDKHESQDEAIRLLQNSDEDNPVILPYYEFWAE